MSSEWSILKIEDIAERVGMGPFGSSIKVETFVESGIPIISGEHLHDITLTEKKFRFITEQHAAQLVKSNVFRGDVVFTHAGTIGQVSVIPEDSKYVKYILSQRQFFMRCKRELVNPLYVAYFFKSPQGRHKLLANASPVGVPSIARPVTYLRSIEIPVPPLVIQNQIVTVIESMRDNITLLRETDATLEGIAQVLFKSWFVDFDPVRAKSEGKLPEGMDEATAALFPDAFDETELGMVPRGWEVKAIGEILNRPLVTKRYTKDQVQKIGNTPVYEQGASILLGFHNDEPSCNATPELPLFIFGDHTCVTKLSCEPFDVSQNVIVLEGSIRNSFWTYFAIKGKQKFEEYRRHWMELIAKKVVVPPSALCDFYSEVATPLQLKIDAYLKKIQTLSNLRDTLLPRLISGQLRITDAEAEIEKVSA